ncbi:MAG: NigD-like protein [Dysgonamonadaceae bacterium]|jgi:hypothetical protein|nr:NigD-like protein [Dysgonamonadaceae bacterium]
MKRSHLISSFIIAASVLFSMLSCLDSDGYSLGDFQVDIASIHAEGDDGMYSLVLDNGEKLFPAATNVFYKPKDGQRVFVNYTLLSDEKDGYDHYVKINDLSKILTKEAITLNAANADSIGNDPVIVKDMWEGGGYLNVHFLFNYGVGDKPHAINLVKNGLSAKPSASEAIELEFRRNAYGSTASWLQEGFACFDLKPFQVSAADSVKFSIKVKEWKATKIFDIVYKYNQAEDNSASRTRVTPVTTSEEYY